jgi:hypothetical protein
MRKEGRNGPDADKNELTGSAGDNSPIEWVEPIKHVVPGIERLGA